MYACNACKKLCRRRDEKEYRQCTAAELDLFDGHDEDGTYASIGIGDKQPPEFAALTVNDRLALGVLQMADAVFKGYGGAGYTHSGGGGLLQPNDFHGMAALLVEAKSDSPDSGMHRRRREALRRLLDPIHGNSLVRSTLTCLEREIDGAMPTICEGSDDGGSEDERDGDGSQIRAQLLHGQTFTGAATSMLPPGETPAAVDNADPTVGVTHKRRGGGAARRQRAEGTSGRSNPDVATFTTLLHQRDGGFAPTENGASRRHYLHKTLGSVATPCRRAEEFIWYHFQMGVKRSLRASGPRMVNPHVALNASGDDVDAHTAQLREHWATLMLQVSHRPHNTSRRSSLQLHTRGMCTCAGAGLRPLLQRARVLHRRCSSNRRRLESLLVHLTRHRQITPDPISCWHSSAAALLALQCGCRHSSAASNRRAPARSSSLSGAPLRPSHTPPADLPKTQS